MKFLEQIQDFPQTKKPIILTIGVFDGIHIGHKNVINKIKEQKDQFNGLSVLLTFNNHPINVLKNKLLVSSISTLEQKKRLIKDLGIDSTPF